MAPKIKHFGSAIYLLCTFYISCIKHVYNIHRNRSFLSSYFVFIHIYIIYLLFAYNTDISKNLFAKTVLNNFLVQTYAIFSYNFFLRFFLFNIWYKIFFLLKQMIFRIKANLNLNTKFLRTLFLLISHFQMYIIQINYINKKKYIQRENDIDYGTFWSVLMNIIIWIIPICSWQIK